MRCILTAIAIINAPAAVRGQAPLPANDPYRLWAESKWGALTVANESLRATQWGESANPDGDRLLNLQEYVFDTDPKTRTVAEPISWSTSVVPGHFSLTFKARQNDPALLVLPQASNDLMRWFPGEPSSVRAWAGDPLQVFTEANRTPVAGNYSTVTHATTLPVGGASSQFTRLFVMRGLTSAVSSPTDGLRFQDGVASAGGLTVDSGAIVPSGFVGSVLISVSGGARLIVDGVDVGTSAQVRAGSEVRLRGISPGSGTVNFNVVINGVASTWTLSTRPQVQPVPIAGTSSGYTPVNASVGENGAANISIPITVPPGTGGMEPKLAITYSSQSPNGLLGVGFSLSGLSAISRSGATEWHDGKKGGVSLTENSANNESNDRFALDGQRLVLESGVWGAPGSTYRTEIDGFSRITALGDTNAGPLSWKVETKAGLVYEYGVTSDSRAMANRPGVPGDTAVLAWAVNRISDNAGNAMEFLYAIPEGTENGNPRISRIRYTRNEAMGLVPLNQAIFTYEDRPDVLRSYVAGTRIELRKRLKRVDTMYGAECFRIYTPAYELDPATGDSRFVSIQESTGSGVVMPPTIFTWPAQGDPKFLNTSTDAGFTIYDRITPNFIGDFNGDGLTDFLDYNAPIADGKSYNFLKSIGNGFAPAVLTDLAPSPISGPIPADYNGDGKMDVLILQHPNTPSGKYQLRFGTDSGFAPPVATTITPVEISYKPTVPGDFNGDGRADLIIWNASRSKYDVYLFTGENFGPATPSNVTVDGNNTYNRDHVYPGEFNGDGRTDLLVFNLPRGKYDLYFANEGGFDSPVPTDIVNYANYMGPGITGDFNGDGLTDFMGYDNFSTVGHYRLYLCNGVGFQPVIETPVTAGQDSLGVKYRQSVDFNGDGKMDIATWHTPFNNFRLNIWISTGEGFAPAVATPIQRADDVLNEVGDFNGDGRTDMLIYHWPLTSRMNLFLNQGPPPRVIEKVANGHGGYTKFTYKPLTDTSIYTKGTTASYPCYDLQASLHVVSSITTRNGADGDPFAATANPVPGETITSYKYERAWMCLDGRGFRGFKAVAATREEPANPALNIVSRTEYETEDPVLAGRPTRELVMLGDCRILSESTNVWTSVPTVTFTPPGAPKANKAFFVFATQSISREFEINSQPANNPVPTKTTTVSGATYDSFGNLKHSLTDYGGGFSEEVSSNYTNDTTKWWLGRLSQTTVTQRAPNQPDQTRQSTFDYSPVNGQVSKETIVTDTTALRLEKTYQHDGFGNITQSTLKDAGTGETRTTITRYTPDGRFIAETENALGQIERKTFDPLTGNTLTQTGPNGLTTRWEYDAFGRPTREIRSDGTTSITQYLRSTPGVDGAPPRAVHKVRTQSAGGSPKTVFFDVLDREIRQDSTSFDGRTVSSHTIYDSRGQATHVSLPFFSNGTTLVAATSFATASSTYTVSEFDEIGRVKKQTAPGSRTTETSYNGLSATVKNPLGQTFTTQQDVRGRTTSASSYGTGGAGGDSIANIHDPYGNLRQVNDGLGHTTVMTYDARGHKTSMQEPNSGLTLYGYNAFGELTSQKDARGITIRLYYDKLGRLTRRDEPEGSSIWEYDTSPSGIGKPARVSRSADGYEEVYRYDSLGRPVETLTRMGSMRFVTGTTYDEFSRPLLTVYPTGFAVRNVYNAQGFLAEVWDAAATGPQANALWKAVTLNARGQIEEEDLGNGLTSRHIYNAATGLVEAVQAGSRAGGPGGVLNAPVQNLGFGWNSIGNLLTRQDFIRPGSAEAFTYDSRNRLETATGPGGHNFLMEYDTAGNITRKRLNSLTAGESLDWNYSYSDPAHPHGVTRVSDRTGGTTVRTLGYDAAGNALSNGDASLTYTSNNQPATITKAGTTLAFSYSPTRARYRQVETTSTGQTIKLYVGGLYEREDTPGATVHTHFIAGGSGVFAILTVTESAVPSTKLRFVHRDHLGSLHTLTDGNGAVSEVLSFDAWGKRRALTFDSASSSFRWTYSTTPSQTDRGFTGHEMLDAVGLVHMNGRIYDPTLGRFLSVDPIVQDAGNLQNLNRYSYVLNNPLSMTDPSGFGFLSSIGKFFKQHWRTIVSVGVGVLTGGLGAWAAIGGQGIGAALTAVATGQAGIWGAIAAGAGFGFGSAFSGTLLAGGSIGDALRAGIKGGAISGIQAGLTFGAADAFGLHNVGDLEWTSAEFAEKVAIKIVAHGVIGGAMSAAQGGKFKHGFFAGAFSGGASPFIAQSGLNAYGQIAAATLVGGTAAEIGGGKFSNGAVTGAFVYLFNEGLQGLLNDGVEEIVGSAVGKYIGKTAGGVVGAVGGYYAGLASDRAEAVRDWPAAYEDAMETLNDPAKGPLSTSGQRRLEELALIVDKFHSDVSGFRSYYVDSMKNPEVLKMYRPGYNVGNVNIGPHPLVRWQDIKPRLQDNWFARGRSF